MLIFSNDKVTNAKTFGFHSMYLTEGYLECFPTKPFGFGSFRFLLKKNVFDSLLNNYGSSLLAVKLKKVSKFLQNADISLLEQVNGLHHILVNSLKKFDELLLTIDSVNKRKKK